MTELWVKKGFGALLPLDKLAMSAIDEMREGVEYRCEITRPRNPKFHRKFMALCRTAYDAWNGVAEVEWKGMVAEKNFDTFYRDIVVLCGHYTPSFHVDGKLTLVPNSISFAKMDEVEFEALYSKAIDVILAKILTHWPRDDLERIVNDVLSFDS